MAQFRQASNK